MLIHLHRNTPTTRARADRRREVSTLAWDAALGLVTAAGPWPAVGVQWSDTQAEALAAGLRAAIPTLPALTSAAWTTAVGSAIARQCAPDPMTYWATQRSALLELADWLHGGGFVVEPRDITLPEPRG